MIGYRVFQLGVPAILGLAAFAGLRRTLAGEERVELATDCEPGEPCFGASVALEPNPA